MYWEMIFFSYNLNGDSPKIICFYCKKLCGTNSYFLRLNLRYSYNLCRCLERPGPRCAKFPPWSKKKSHFAFVFRHSTLIELFGGKQKKKLVRPENNKKELHKYFYQFFSRIFRFSATYREVTLKNTFKPLIWRPANRKPNASLTSFCSFFFRCIRTSCLARSQN